MKKSLKITTILEDGGIEIKGRKAGKEVVYLIGQSRDGNSSWEIRFTNNETCDFRAHRFSHLEALLRKL